MSIELVSTASRLNAIYFASNFSFRVLRALSLSEFIIELQIFSRKGSLTSSEIIDS